MKRALESIILSLDNLIRTNLKKVSFFDSRDSGEISLFSVEGWPSQKENRYTKGLTLGTNFERFASGSNLNRNTLIH